MNEHDIEVLFVSSGGSSRIPSPVVAWQLESIRKENITIGSFTTRRGLVGYIKSIYYLKKYLASKKNIKAIHAHYGWCGIVALLARNKQKVVISFMGDDLVGVVGKNGKYTLAGRLVAGLNIFLARHFYDHIIVKSDNLRNRLKGIDNVSVIPNGVDMHVFYELEQKEAKAKVGLANKKKYVLFVSDPSRPEKNYKLAREAVSLLGDKDIELLPLSGLAHQDLLYYYNAADCLILTSFHEGSPNVIKEAMACNCPIVSTDVGDVREVLRDTEGCFVASYDPADFAHHIRQALNFTQNQGRTRGRERILELGLDSESTARRIIEVYKKALKG
jgi:glycosyltransferase involved in cell wall biosynthesis